MGRSEGPAGETVGAEGGAFHQSGPWGLCQCRQAERAKDGDAIRPDQAAGLKQGQVIHQTGAQKGGGELAACLDQDAGQAFGGEGAERKLQALAAE